MSIQKRRHSQFRERVTFETTGVSRVDQSQRELTDINKIVARAQRTGQWPYRPDGRQPFYADCSQVGDLLQSYEVVQRAEAAFMALPAEIRREMDNDPRNLTTWLSDPANVKDAIKHGLLTVQEVPQGPGQAPAGGQQPPEDRQPPKAPKASKAPSKPPTSSDSEE